MVNQKNVETIASVVIRFAGDSGDGMQLTGGRFTQESARLGNDLVTRPDFPAEIRAPSGTVAGVSAFQIQIGSEHVFTSGDALDVLVAMNPAALRANLEDLKPNGMLLCNSDAFTERNYQRVGYSENPVEQEELTTKYNVVSAPITSLTLEALKETSLSKSAQDKCKNFFALGLICHIYGRPISETVGWIERKFSKDPEVAKANLLAMHGGMAFAEASELFSLTYEIPRAKLAPGTYRNLTGNQGIAFGLLAAAKKSGLPLYYSGYPITPASDILHELSKHKNFGVKTLQAEDEIAACCSAIGAAYAGHLAITASSGPGIILKQEAIGLAVMTELPLVIVNVQRAGPSTGMPTKTEQADLLEVLYGRNGECPVVVLAIAQPEDAFTTTVEACRISLEHMIPVFLLSDGFIGNSSQPWKIPSLDSIPEITAPLVQEKDREDFLPYQRDPKTLARKWAIPGTAGFEHRIGGIEKKDGTGNISYEPDNHQLMTQIRAEKITRIADSLPETVVNGDQSGQLLIISWGGTFGAVAGAVTEARQQGIQVGHVHLRYLNPLPRDLEEIMSNFKQILVPELNSGQLSMLLRAKTLRDVHSLSKVQGQPFKIGEITSRIQQEISRHV